MKLVIALALALPVGAAAKTMDKGWTANEPFPYPIHEKTLANGLRIAVVPTGHDGMFALREIVGTGSRDEVEKGHSGFAHFFEHMMFRGTKAWPADKRGDLLESLGVNEGGFTTDDFTTYWMVGPVRALQQIVELEADRYQNLEYSEADFKTEAKAVLGEYNKNFSNPDLKAWEALRALAFDRHTYEHTTLGFRADIEKMPERFAYSRKFFERFYTPDNVLLLVVGDVDPAVVFQLVEERFAGWQGKRATTKVSTEPAPKGARREHVKWPSPTVPRGHVAWRVPATSDAKAAATARVLEAYLFSDSSPLIKELQLEERKIEALSSWWSSHKDPMLFPVNYRLREGATHDEVIDRIQAALDKLATGPDAERFEAVKSNVRYALLMELTSADNVASTVGWRAGPELAPRAVNDELRAIAALTPADLTAFVKANFGKERRTVITLAHEPGSAP